MISDFTSGKLKYILYKPSDEPNLPLVVVLHGSGEIGSSLSKLKKREPYISLNNGKCKPNACIMMPQLPKNNWIYWKNTLYKLIFQVATENKCDMSRISITGHSLGANGTMDFLFAFPSFFVDAAVLSPCKDYGDKLKELVHIPIWFLHGEKEHNYKKYAQQMEARLEKFGGKTKITSVTGYGHPIQFCWTSEKYRVLEWLMDCTVLSKGTEFENDLPTGKQLADYCEGIYANRDHWCYWCGTYGNKCTMSKYNRKKKQYPEHYKENRTAAYMKDIEEGRRCADCIGMLKSFFWTGGKLDSDPIYKSNNCPDKSEDSMFKMCKKKGPINTLPNIPGIVVWKKGHIGVYVGNGFTVEMKGFAYDCVRNKVGDGSWTNWGMLPDTMIRYDDESASESHRTWYRDLKKGCKGVDVRELQKDLIKLGFSLPKYGVDGDYGNETTKAVKAFQVKYGLADDGVMNLDKDFDVLIDALTTIV